MRSACRGNPLPLIIGPTSCRGVHFARLEAPLMAERLPFARVRRVTGAVRAHLYGRTYAIDDLDSDGQRATEDERH